MKRKIFVVLTGILMGLILCASKVSALENDSTLTTKYIDNVYAYHYKSGVVMSYGKLPYRYQDGKLVYCIEPWRVIGENTYSSTDDWSMSGYTEEEKKRMELIVHYGYGYEGHDSLNYYLATQELIWLFKDDYVKWTTEYNENGPVINVENEKNEILRLVNLHDTIPSFSGRCFVQYLNDKVIVNDTNNVIDNYDIITDLKYTKNGSIIKFELNKFGKFNVKFVSKNLSGESTKVYYVNNSNSQKMALFGFSDKKEVEISIIVEKAYMRINKRDNVTKDLIKDVGTIFKVKNTDTNTYVDEKLEVGKNGYATISLKKGNYEIEEINASNGYVINKEKKKIKIDDNIKMNGPYFDVDIFNDKPKGKITINKTDEEKNILSGVEIGLFDKDYKQINTLITKDKDNYFSDLELGTYYIKELNTIEGYKLYDEYIKVDLSYIDDKTHIVNKDVDIINSKILCDIVYITSSEDKLLKDVELNVYNEKDEIVFNGKTDENGQVIINNLPYGRYYIKQIKVPSGYILNEEEYVLYVNDSTCIGKINVTNEKTVMPVTSTSINKCAVLFLIFSSLGIFNFVKKNS